MLNGDGLRTVLWVAGCEHRCRGCHNPITWDIDGGIPFDEAAEQELFEKLSADYISGITFSGGDPLHKRNREEITRLAKKVRETLPEKTIWLYTGYNWEDIQDLEIVPLLDVIVDGQYVEAVRNPKLHWKGSANQRVIDVQETLRLGKLVLFDSGGTMKRIAKFEKVSLKQFVEGCERPDAESVYNEIKLPKRATAGSAGYDFYAPYDVKLAPGETAKIPTGIRALIEPGWVLKLYPRSGLGFKYRLQLNNTVGIIDSDYSQSDNEGHIFIKITNDSNEGKTLEIPAGTGFAQGIFVEYGITVDDDADGVRNGGFGSTTK